MENINLEEGNSQKQNQKSPKVKTPPKAKDELDIKIDKMY